MQAGKMAGRKKRARHVAGGRDDATKPVWKPALPPKPKAPEPTYEETVDAWSKEQRRVIINRLRRRLGL